MSLPNLVKTKDNVTVLNSFIGLNKNLRIREDEFMDMSNMTLDHFPVISNRSKRGVLSDLTKPLGFCGGDKLTFIDNNKLYYDFTYVCDLAASDKERQIVVMGSYICIFPDGLVYDTKSHEIKSIENETKSTTTVTMRMCKLDGQEFNDSNTYIGTTAPSDPTLKPYWLDTSKEDAVVLKMYSSTYSMWTSVATTYVKISSTNIGKGFNEYDAVKIDGITIKGYNDYDFNDTLIVYAASDDYIIVAGLMDLYHTQSATVTLKRTLPELDYVCELDNRIWGCSSSNHEIYACKQGSPFNWNFYAGFDSDSYAATVGSQGDFTGAFSYSGNVFFFKEDGFHKLYGTKPSNYEMIFKPCRGVQKGCSKSLAIVDEMMVYKSRDAVVAYDGSINVISEKLGIEPYFDAVAVGYRNKYYISMRDSDYRYRLYVYDFTKAAWVIEDDLRLKYAVYANNGTYLIDFENHMYCINKEKMYQCYFPSQTELGDKFLYPSSQTFAGNMVEGSEEDDLEWSFMTSDLGLDNPYNKYLKRLNVRMELESSTKLRIEVEYESSGIFDYVIEFTASRKKSYEIPIVVKRADHIRFRFSGKGVFKLFAIAKAVEAGSGENETT